MVPGLRLRFAHTICPNHADYHPRQQALATSVSQPQQPHALKQRSPVSINYAHTAVLKDDTNSPRPPQGLKYEYLAVP